MVELPKNLIKMIILKHFTSLKQRDSWRKLFSPHQIKASYVSGVNILLTAVYRNTQTFDFQMLRECSTWMSRNGAVEMFFSFFVTPTRNVFLDVFQEYIFCNVEWIEARKMSEVFWVKFRFFGTVLWHFIQCHFKFCCCPPTMVADIFTQPPLPPPWKSFLWLLP